MGIKSLHTFLKKHCPFIYEKCTLDEYRYEKIAIDTSIYICKFKTIYGKRWLDAFLLLISALRRNDIHPLFVFDTSFPPEKALEKKNRQIAREKNKDRVLRIHEDWLKFREVLLTDFLREEDDTASSSSPPSSSDRCQLFKKFMLNNETSTCQDAFRIIPDLFFSIYHPDLPSSLKDVIVRQVDMPNPSLVFALLEKSACAEERDGGDDVFRDKNKVSLRSMDQLVDSIMNSLLVVSTGDYEKVKALFEILKIPTFQAIGEAEATCSWLCESGYVAAVLTEDTDVLAYGCPVFLHKLNLNDGTCSRIQHQTMLDALQLERHSFLDFCILCGTDYNKNLSKIGSDRGYKLILAHRDLEHIEQYYQKNTQYEVSEELYDEFKKLQYKRIREIFTSIYRFEGEIPFSGVPDWSLLKRFCFENNIKYSLDELFFSCCRPQSSIQWKRANGTVLSSENNRHHPCETPNEAAPAPISSLLLRKSLVISKKETSSIMDDVSVTTATNKIIC